MYTPSPDEFALLNNDEKLKIVENLENSIELQKKQYFSNYNEEIPISFYYPKLSYFNIKSTFNQNQKNNNENNCLLSSSSFSSSENEKNRNKVINKAKDSIIQIKKNLENFNNKYELKEKENKNLKSISNDLNNSETIQEINYIIESTTNSYDSTRKSRPAVNNFISNKPLNIDYSKQYEENDSNQKVINNTER